MNVARTSHLIINAILAVFALCITSCSDLRCDEDLSCSPCRHAEIFYNGKTDECRCVPNADSICPEIILHGYYNFGLCECQCIPGWLGTLCDRRDSSFFINFFHGTDTAAFNDTIKTDSIWIHAMDLIVYPDSEVVKCTFPAGSPIDSLKLARYPSSRGTYRFCEGEDDCISMKLYFANGDSAYSVSDTLIIETVTGIHYTRGRFKTNLQMHGSAQPYYIRNGRFIFPF